MARLFVSGVHKVSAHFFPLPLSSAPPPPPPPPPPRALRSVFVKTGNQLYMADTCSGRQRSQTSVCLADLLSKFVPLSRMPYLPLLFLAVPSGSGSNPPRKRRERGHSEVLGWGGKGVGDAVAYSGFVRCLYTFGYRREFRMLWFKQCFFFGIYNNDAIHSLWQHQQVCVA